jgi:hypothetical protein
MGWRDFQPSAPMEFMESMESMTVSTPLIPLIPLIPIETDFKNEVGTGIPPNSGKDLLHYCNAGDCHCSAKLPGSDYPADCSRCADYQEATVDI